MNSHTHVHRKVNQEKVLINFKKAQSHIASMMKMVEQDAYCIDVMQQNRAVMGLLKSAHQMIMEDHLHSCFEDAVASRDTDRQAQMVDEILRVSKLSNK